MEVSTIAFDRFKPLADDACEARIVAAKKALGDRAVILGHHYQRDDVICHADLTGDSFKLSQMASERKNADYIVFCGVHFMAESADILSADHQQVIRERSNSSRTEPLLLLLEEKTDLGRMFTLDVDREVAGRLVVRRRCRGHWICHHEWCKSFGGDIVAHDSRRPQGRDRHR